MEQISILVVEDDLEINQLISTYLTKEGFQVDSAVNGKEALALLNNHLYQLVILDLMLPEVDGYEILRQLRRKYNMPVLILTAKAEESDKVIGLGLGADDYLTKPFSISELIARVKAQLRRYLYFNEAPVKDTGVLKVLDLEMEISAHEVRIAGKSISLTAKEFEILRLFVTNPRRVFTKAQIFQQVWNEEYLADENTVLVHIRRLREKIEVDPANPRYIQTVWGVGYKLGEV